MSIEALMAQILAITDWYRLWSSWYQNLCWILFNCRKGSRLGHDSLVDGMLKDGLWDVYNDYGMGVCAELCADTHEITREEQVLLWFRMIYSVFFCLHLPTRINFVGKIIYVSFNYNFFGWLMQDNYAIQSFERGIAAQDAGAFTWEIASVRQIQLNN